MGLLANSMVNPEAAFGVAGVGFSDAQPQRQGTWLSLALVAALHMAGLYAIATWTPRSEWLKLWKPVEVTLIQEEAPKPPEVKYVEEPPPPPKPQVAEREPVPPPSQPKVEEKPVVPEQPAPVMAAAPNVPAVVEAPTFVVPPQPEAPPPPLPAPRVQAAAPPAPRTVAKVEFIRAPDPAYPMMSRRLGEQGKVMIRALVDEQGHAIDVAIQYSSGKPRLDEAAKKAVMGALFKPYREDGKAEQVYVVVPVVFKMES